MENWLFLNVFIEVNWKISFNKPWDIFSTSPMAITHSKIMLMKVLKYIWCKNKGVLIYFCFISRNKTDSGSKGKFSYNIVIFIWLLFRFFNLRDFWGEFWFTRVSSYIRRFIFSILLSIIEAKYVWYSNRLFELTFIIWGNNRMRICIVGYKVVVMLEDAKSLLILLILLLKSLFLELDVRVELLLRLTSLISRLFSEHIRYLLRRLTCWQYLSSTSLSTPSVLVIA